MKVKELIALLEKEDPEMEVVHGSSEDGWYYDTDGIYLYNVLDGRLTDDRHETCCVIIE